MLIWRRMFLSLNFLVKKTTTPNTMGIISIKEKSQCISSSLQVGKCRKHWWKQNTTPQSRSLSYLNKEWECQLHAKKDLHWKVVLLLNWRRIKIQINKPDLHSVVIVPKWNRFNLCKGAIDPRTESPTCCQCFN